VSNPLKKLAGQTAIYGLSSIVGRFLNYLLTPLWTGIFSTEQFGIITEMYAYVAFLVVLLTYGMETAYFRFTSKNREDASIFSTILISVVSSAVFFIVICSLFSQNIADWLMYPDHKEYIIWFAVIVGVDAIASLPLAKLRQQNKSLKFALVNLLNVAVNISLNWFLLVYCKGHYDEGVSNYWVETFYNPEIGVGYIFIANLIASLIKFIVLIPELLNNGFVFNKPLYRKMLRYALPLLLVGLAGIVNETIDRIMLKQILLPKIGLKSTMEQLGIYGANYKLSIIITMFIQAFRYAAEPFFFAQEKKMGSKNMYGNVMNYFVIVVGAMFLVVLLYLDVFKHFIRNDDFWEGLKVVPVLLFANICLGIYFNLSIWYKLSSKTGFGALISIFGAIITIVLNFILIPKFGYMGSAWATLFCYLSMVVVSYKLGQKHYPIPYNLKKAGFYIGLSVLLYFVFIKLQAVGETNFALSTLLLLVYLISAYIIEQKKLFLT
jgi:O-antigen/teichoic acid export membrane protein